MLGGEIQVRRRNSRVTRSKNEAIFLTMVVLRPDWGTAELVVLYANVNKVIFKKKLQFI